MNELNELVVSFEINRHFFSAIAIQAKLFRQFLLWPTTFGDHANYFFK